jgi:hypothetical protein
MWTIGFADRLRLRPHSPPAQPPTTGLILTRREVEAML